MAVIDQPFVVNFVQLATLKLLDGSCTTQEAKERIHSPF